MFGFLCLRGAECNTDHHFLCTTLRTNRHCHVEKEKWKGDTMYSSKSFEENENKREDQQILKDIYVGQSKRWVTSGCNGEI